MPGVKRKVVVSKDGPYLVSGGLPLVKEVIINDSAGDALEWRLTKKYPHRETYALCRCGKSKNKPFCDGTHTKKRSDGSEPASRKLYSEQAEIEEGRATRVCDVPSLCAASRF